MRPIIAVPAIVALVVRAWRKNSLTTLGILAAVGTAVAHAYHPWNLPFVLLIVFFLAGTRATHVKANVKKTLTVDSMGGSGGEGPRTHVQVLANSLMASILSVLHARQLNARDASAATCYSWPGDLLAVGIIANYAAVAADTFSSELGILSKSQPRLITSLTLRKVPRGTNGGVTLLGLGAGVLGSAIIVAASMLCLPMCTSSSADGSVPSVRDGGRPWSREDQVFFAVSMIIWGALGSVLDSVLGAVLQRTVKDVRSGKIIEGHGGRRALVSADPAGPVVSSPAKPGDARAAVLNGAAARRGSRVVENGLDWLDNNEVNFVMAATMSVGAMAVAGWYWGVPMQSIISH